MRAVTLALLFLGSFVCGQESELILVQVFHRHGSKVPDLLEPSTTPYWTRWGNAGDLTEQGILEMEEFGQYIRTKYIEEAQFLSDEYDQNEVYARASSYNPRPLQSASTVFSSLYPDAPVPIYSVNPSDEDLLATSLTKTCPSFYTEESRLYKQYDEHLEEYYGDLMDAIVEITEYEEMRPSDLLGHLGDKYESESAHFYPMHPFLRDNAHTFMPLVQAYYNMPLLRLENDPRGDHYQKLGREVLSNLRAATQGAPRKLAVYSSHGSVIAGMRSLLQLDMRERVDYAEAIVMELRRNPTNGLFTVRAQSLLAIREGIVGRVTYEVSPIPLTCPDQSFVCPLDSFLEYLTARVGPLNGCCVRSQGFFELGCQDFLNPDTLSVPECRRWRERCPQTACGSGQVVDSVTLECVRIQMN